MQWRVELAFAWLNRDYLSLSLTQLLSSVECTDLYHRVVSLNSEQDICACFWHSSVAAVFNLYSRHVAAHELQLHPINQPNLHWCCCSDFTHPVLLKPHRTVLNSAVKRKHAGGSRDRPPWTHWTNMQRWNQEDQHPGGVETEISTGVEECEKQQRFHRYSSNKREAKDRVSYCWTGMVRKKWLNAQKNMRYWMPSLPQPFLARFPQVSHTPEGSTTRDRKIRVKTYVQAGQYMHLWLTGADQCHSSLEFSSKWSSSPGTARKEMSQRLTSVLGKITWQFLLKAIPK